MVKINYIGESSRILDIALDFEIKENGYIIKVCETGITYPPVNRWDHFIGNFFLSKNEATLENIIKNISPGGSHEIYYDGGFKLKE